MNMCFQVACCFVFTLQSAHFVRASLCKITVISSCIGDFATFTNERDGQIPHFDLVIYEKSH